MQVDGQVSLFFVFFKDLLTGYIRIPAKSHQDILSGQGRAHFFPLRDILYILGQELGPLLPFLVFLEAFKSSWR